MTMITSNLKRFFLLLTFSVLMACGPQSSPTGEADDRPAFEGSFLVEVSSGDSFSDAAQGARIEVSEGDMIGLQARRWHLRIDPRITEDAAVTSTNEILRNNTFLHMPFEMDGKAIRIGCDPSTPVEGRFERSKLTDSHISGSFFFTVHRCTNFYSGEAVDVPGLPWTVSGRFEDLPLTNP